MLLLLSILAGMFAIIFEEFNGAKPSTQSHAPINVHINSSIQIYDIIVRNCEQIESSSMWGWISLKIHKCTQMNSQMHFGI